MKCVPSYTDRHGNTVVFRKCVNVPGFTHRVIVNGTASGWLAHGFHPSAKTALFFLKKAQGEIT